MASPLSEIVQNYADLVTELNEKWRAHGSAVAKKLDDRTYDVDGVVADLAAGARLTAETGFLWASEALDSLAILTGRQGEPHVVTAGPFSTTLAGATLKVTAPLVNGHKSDALPVSAVRFDPSTLGAGETTFRIHADATGHRSGIYKGDIEASTPVASETLPVHIRVG